MLFGVIRWQSKKLLNLKNVLKFSMKKNNYFTYIVYSGKSGLDAQILIKGDCLFVCVRVFGDSCENLS